MKYYLLSIGQSPNIDYEGLKAELNDLKDWAKFHYNQFIVLTSVEASEINAIARKHIPDEATSLVMELNVDNRWGTVPKVVADWLNKDHSHQSGR